MNYALQGTLVTVVAAVLGLGLPGRVSALTACEDPDFCGPGTGACTINSLTSVDAGSDIDCSGRDLTINGNGKIRVDDGFFTLKADDLNVFYGGSIQAREVSPGTPVGMTLELSGVLILGGALRANNASGGGSITVDAAGDILVTHEGTDGIEANGTSGGGDGGEITLISGGNVTLHCKVLAEGASGGVTNGGQVTIRAAGDILIDDHSEIRVTARKGEAGSIRLEAGGNIITTAGRKLEANGKLDEGNGGEIYLAAGDALILGFCQK